jgi:adenylyl- and sulfurtransferase ThiI
MIGLEQFSIVCRIRNCQKIDRQDLTKTIAGLVGKEHQVDLVNPDLVIIVEVLQVCSNSYEVIYLDAHCTYSPILRLSA